MSTCTLYMRQPHTHQDDIALQNTIAKYVEDVDKLVLASPTSECSTVDSVEIYATSPHVSEELLLDDDDDFKLPSAMLDSDDDASEDLMASNGFVVQLQDFTIKPPKTGIIADGFMLPSPVVGWDKSVMQIIGHNSLSVDSLWDFTHVDMRTLETRSDWSFMLPEAQRGDSCTTPVSQSESDLSQRSLLERIVEMSCA